MFKLFSNTCDDISSSIASNITVRRTKATVVIFYRTANTQVVHDMCLELWKYVMERKEREEFMDTRLKN